MIIFYILNLFQGKTLHAEYIYDNRVGQKILVFEKRLHFKFCSYNIHNFKILIRHFDT